MNSVEIIVLNFEEIRRRSIILWKAIPVEFYHWRPDKDAMTCLEMVRHVLESEFYYHSIIATEKCMTDYPSPWDGLPCISVFDELELASPYRQKFLQEIKKFSDHDLEMIQIIRPGKQNRLLGDFLNRVGYHEAVHTGQLLSYLRFLKIDRPGIWD